jgi:hypothetical protein
VSFYTVTAPVTVPAYTYIGLGAACNLGDTVTGGGLSDSLYYGSSGQLLESYPHDGTDIQGWEADVENGYSQAEEFDVYAICEHSTGTTSDAGPASADASRADAAHAGHVWVIRSARRRT